MQKIGVWQGASWMSPEPPQDHSNRSKPSSMPYIMTYQLSSTKQLNVGIYPLIEKSLKRYGLTSKIP
jgi:hypothetical protein